ncbi:MAG: AAA family ATPase [Bacteroidia bacterium]|nr:AAA family ATPase [Bacteroidia bacterium]
MEVDPDIIVIRGAPGTGKSQTSKNLALLFPKGVRMEVDTIRQMVISVDWENQQEHIHMLQASAKLGLEFLNLGCRPVIIVDTFSGDKINRFLETLYEHNKHLQIKIFALYTTDDELKRRLGLRTNGEFKNYTICKKLNDDVLRWKHESEFQINTTGLLPKQTAEKVYELIHKGAS